jgi:hypothetical protein
VSTGRMRDVKWKFASGQSRLSSSDMKSQDEGEHTIAGGEDNPTREGIKITILKGDG